MSLDRVFVEGLSIDTVIGVYDWERKVRQTVVIDLEMAWDIARAAASDDLSHALDYAEVSKRLTETISSSQFQLVEALAESAAELILKEFSVKWLRLTLYKPGAVANAQSVGLKIERGTLGADHG